MQRAAHLAELARRRYLAVDPDNRLVADTLESDWNDALRQLAAAQDDYQRQHDAATAAISDAQRAHVLALAADFPALWNDPATPQRERKRMVRLLIEDVTLHKTGAITIDIRLKGGQTATLSAPIPPRAWEARQTPPEIITAIDRLLDHHTDTEIAEILNQKGLRSGDHKPFHRLMIRNLRESYQLRPRYDRLRHAGMLTLAEIAQHLQLSTATIKTYRREGLLAGHAYNDKNECLYPIPDTAPNKQTGRPPKNGRPNKEPSERP